MAYGSYAAVHVVVQLEGKTRRRARISGIVFNQKQIPEIETPSLLRHAQRTGTDRQFLGTVGLVDYRVQQVPTVGPALQLLLYRQYAINRVRLQISSQNQISSRELDSLDRTSYTLQLAGTSKLDSSNQLEATIILTSLAAGTLTEYGLY